MTECTGTSTNDEPKGEVLKEDRKPKRVTFSDELGQPLFRIFRFFKDEDEYPAFFPEWRTKQRLRLEMQRLRALSGEPGKRTVKRHKHKHRTHKPPQIRVKRLTRWFRYINSREHQRLSDSIRKQAADKVAQEREQEREGSVDAPPGGPD